MLAQSVANRFTDFADQCVQFVEEVGADLQEVVDPVAEARRSAEIIGAVTKKWTVPIIYLLYRTEQLRFSDLGKLLMGISSRTLSLRLKSLEARGWIHREVVEDRPPSVLYSLTERGVLIAKMAGPMYLYLRLTADQDRHIRSDQPGVK